MTSDSRGDARYNNYEFYKAFVAYQRALDYLSREQNPLLLATVLIDIGMAQWEIGIRAAGPAIHGHLNEAVQAYQKALEVYTRKELPQNWAMTQNNLAEAYMMLEDWTNAADSFVNVLYLYPDYRKAYEKANFLYHEKLFAFVDAFALNEAWVERHPRDISAQNNFAEVHFTTGRFAKAESRFAAPLANRELETPEAIPLQAFEIATLIALKKHSAIPPKLRALRAGVAAQPNRLPIRWTFAGAKHFIRQHKRLADHNYWLIELLSALEKRDRSAVLAVLDDAQQGIFAVEENQESRSRRPFLPLNNVGVFVALE